MIATLYDYRTGALIARDAELSRDLAAALATGDGALAYQDADRVWRMPEPDVDPDVPNGARQVIGDFAPEPEDLADCDRCGEEFSHATMVATGHPKTGLFCEPCALEVKDSMPRSW